ncbi:MULTISPECIES: trypsin-like serine protease [Corynebacterium]|uniref:Trypsin-like serine protease n=1 Tax=Corynebacterium pseudodiphtheriticum TaxID=37637 RepID=A0ABT7FU48_9CORY|nr:MULTISPECIES: trypsin-like serine protease [Corynebacterium]MCG7252757.1 S1 family peptidase [Corynebacterium pseudodiphtheriticum]MDK4281741.1 trypsin-like serine protease [Corynebacterium propinquum]MDK4289506.1 trypsin-like serine protease [Corynebacterium pseudodiphtheriticum]MDK4339781.1 trypsin-like serine protease [Corynebacterium pseudodiphtheriticum]
MRNGILLALSSLLAVGALPSLPSAQASETSLVMSSFSTSSEDAEKEDIIGKVTTLNIPSYGIDNFCTGYLLNEKWMITAAHCFASGLPLKNYIAKNSETESAPKEIYFKADIDVALVEMQEEFNVTDCASLPPHPPQEGEEVTVYSGKEGKGLPFTVQSVNHLASNPSINIQTHPMLSLSPTPSGRLTQSGESGAPLFSVRDGEKEYLQGIISGISTQQELSLAEDVFRIRDFINKHAGECSS